MKVGNVKVFFRYEENGTTRAIAKNVETEQEIASREVKLRHGDKPCKIIGRKYVFKKLMTHALDNNLLPGAQVEAFWKQFSSTCKQPTTKLAY